MKAFIDTSTLVKKYVQEEGSDAFSVFLEKISEIFVAPTYFIELNSAVKNKIIQKQMNAKQAQWLIAEAKKDLFYFSVVKFNENLVSEACRLIEKYKVKSLDAIQLGSAVLSKTNIFITSDNSLYQVAKLELKNTQLI